MNRAGADNLDDGMYPPLPGPVSLRRHRWLTIEKDEGPHAVSGVRAFIRSRVRAVTLHGAGGQVTPHPRNPAAPSARSNARASS